MRGATEEMEKIRGVLDSPFLAGVSLVLALVSIILAYIFFRKSQRARTPSWAIRTTNLIRDYTSKLSDLEIRYRQQQVKDLSISRVVFWNDGAETIDREDVASTDPVRIAAAAGM